MASNLLQSQDRTSIFSNALLALGAGLLGRGPSIGAPGRSGIGPGLLGFQKALQQGRQGNQNVAFRNAQLQGQEADRGIAERRVKLAEDSAASSAAQTGELQKRIDAFTSVPDNGFTDIQNFQLKAAAAAGDVGAVNSALNNFRTTASRESIAKARNAFAQSTKPGVALRFPDGTVKEFPAGDPRINQGRELGAVTVKLGVQSGSVDELGLSGRDKSKAVDQAIEEASGIARLSNFLKRAKKTPGAFGLMGVATQTLGGFVGQFNKAAERGIAKTFSDATPSQVQALRTEARTIVAQSLTAVTGEESGRFSEPERAQATEALRTLTPTASEAQIAAAGQTMLRIKILSEDRQALKAGLPVVPLETKGQIAQEVGKLRKMGLSDDQVVNTLQTLIEQRKRIRRLTGGK